MTCFLRSIYRMLHFCLCLFSPIVTYSCYMVLLLQMAEYRISIYGRKQSEWDQLASWIVNNDLYSENVVWLIQVLTISKSPYWSYFFLVSQRKVGLLSWVMVGLTAVEHAVYYEMPESVEKIEPAFNFMFCDIFCIFSFLDCIISTRKWGLLHHFRIFLIISSFRFLRSQLIRIHILSCMFSWNRFAIF